MLAYIHLKLHQRSAGKKRSAKTISSSDKSGHVSTLHNGSLAMEHIILATTPTQLPKTRKSDCEVQNCTSLCVVTPKAFPALIKWTTEEAQSLQHKGNKIEPKCLGLCHRWELNPDCD